MATDKHATALFVGSFNPFTIGHDDIVQRALRIFDRLVIGVGMNPGKDNVPAAEERVAAIRALYEDNENVRITTFSGLAVELAKRVGAVCIVKGVRSVKDFEYEREQAVLNKQLAGIETVLLFADPTLAAISSGAVRELQLFNQDVSWMLPKKNNNNPDQP